MAQILASPNGVALTDVYCSGARTTIRTRDGPRRICGPTPPLRFFDSLDETAQTADVLFLGADPWHLVASLANRPSKALLLVRAAIVHADPWEVARSMLLLHLLTTLKADQRERCQYAVRSAQPTQAQATHADSTASVYSRAAHSVAAGYRQMCMSARLTRVCS